MTAIETPAPFIVEKIRPPMVTRGKASQRLGKAGMLDLGVQIVAPSSINDSFRSPGDECVARAAGRLAYFPGLPE